MIFRSKNSQVLTLTRGVSDIVRKNSELIPFVLRGDLASALSEDREIS